MKYNYGVAIVFFNPDIMAIERVYNYLEVFNKLLIVDNTPDYKCLSSEIYNKIEDIKKYKIIHYLKDGKNKGMSEALNISYQWACQNNIDFLLTMDQDTDYEKFYIKRMIDFIETESRGSTAIYAANWRKIYIKDGKEVYGKWRYSNSITEIHTSITSGSFYDIDIIKNYLPLPNLFIGMVDDDISYAVKNDGYKVKVIGFSKLSQRVGKPVKKTIINVISNKVILDSSRYFYMARNSKYLLRKYKENKRIEFIIRMKRLRIVINLFLFEENKIHKIKKWIEGNREKFL